MIGYLTGTIVDATENPILLLVHGVGYRVYIPEHKRSTIHVNQEEQFYIHAHIREDMFDLYGFTTKQERVLFELLLTISGIGPRTALAIIDRGIKNVQNAVIASDVSFFTSIARVGTKNAQKIIIELKPKLSDGANADLTGLSDSAENKMLIDALTSMGFKRSEVFSVLRLLPDEETAVEERVRIALKMLGTKRKHP